MRINTVAGVALAVLAWATTGCTPLRTGAEIDILMDYGMRSSTERMAQGNALESLQLARAVAEIDPRYPGVQDALAGMPSDLENLFDNKVLGSNVAIRQPIDARWYEYVLWYIPDRILDLFDVFSFDVHMGPGIWVDAHATRAMQLSLGARSVAGIGWHDSRSLGFQTQSQAGVNFLPFGVEGYSAMEAGTSGVKAGTWSESGLHNPSSPLYVDYKDYWAIGAGATVVFVGAEADIHPIQIFDFLVGFFLFDPANDDFASTTGVQLSTRERQLMRSLGEIASSKEEIEAYYIWKGMQERDAKAAIAEDAAAIEMAETVEEAVDTPAVDPEAAPEPEPDGVTDPPEPVPDDPGDSHFSA